MHRVDADRLAKAVDDYGTRIEALPHFGLATPRSRCPHCGHQLSWYENIPLVSWLAQGGIPVPSRGEGVEAAAAGVLALRGGAANSLVLCFAQPADAAAVLRALPGSARLILLGDKDQLASVEAGAVLGDFSTVAAGTLASVQTLRYSRDAVDGGLRLREELEVRVSAPRRPRPDRRK